MRKKGNAKIHDCVTLTSEQLLQRLMDLFDAKNDSDLCEKSGIGRSTLGNWKSRASLPKLPVIIEIANRTGASLDFLLLGREAHANQNDAALASETFNPKITECLGLPSSANVEDVVTAIQARSTGDVSISERKIARPVLAPEFCRDMEASAQSLNRVVLAIGGHPIPEDLWPALAEHMGLTDIHLDATSVMSLSECDGLDNDSGATNKEVYTVPFAEDVRAAAGSGEMVFEEAAGLKVEVPRSILPGWVRPHGLSCIRAAGDSMEPTLHDGDMILLDHTQTEPVDGKIFVLHTEDGLVVKRLRTGDGGWKMTSDNPSYQPRLVGEWDRPVGRLAWSGPLRATWAHGG